MVSNFLRFFRFTHWLGIALCVLSFTLSAIGVFKITPTASPIYLKSNTKSTTTFRVENISGHSLPYITATANYRPTPLFHASLTKTPTSCQKLLALDAGKECTLNLTFDALSSTGKGYVYPRICAYSGYLCSFVQTPVEVTNLNNIITGVESDSISDIIPGNSYTISFAFTNHSLTQSANDLKLSFSGKNTYIITTNTCTNTLAAGQTCNVTGNFEASTLLNGLSAKLTYTNGLPVIVSYHKHPKDTVGFMDDWTVINNLEGALQGMVSFVQSTTIRPKINQGINRPLLVTDKQALVLYTPLPGSNINTAKSDVTLDLVMEGVVVKHLTMTPPALLPPSDQGTTRFPKVSFSNKSYSATIPWNLMKKGLSLRFMVEGQAGLLKASDINFGSATQLILHNIRIGGLTTVPPETAIEKDFAYMAQYFQTLPVAQLVLDNYSPLHLTKLFYPNGTEYTDKYPGDGGVYTGGIEHFARDVIARTILAANAGYLYNVLNWEPIMQRVNMVVHGKYNNGVISHGLHATWIRTFLRNTLGNEFSHEIGHTFGLGHYEGGDLSGHKHQDGWAYDFYDHMFLSNLQWNAGAFTVYNEPPFLGIFSYGTDAMAGGYNNGSSVSNYTLYTPFSQQKIQNNIQGYRRLSKDGQHFMGYDPATQKMVDKTTSSDIFPREHGVPVVTLSGYYDPEKTIASGCYFFPAMYAGYGNVFTFAAPKVGDCKLEIKNTNGDDEVYGLPASRFATGNMNKFQLNVARSKEPYKINIYCPPDLTTPMCSHTILPPTTEPSAVVIGEDYGYKQIVNKTAFTVNATSGPACSIAKQSSITLTFNKQPERSLETGNLYVNENGQSVPFTLSSTNDPLKYNLVLNNTTPGTNKTYDIQLQNVKDIHGQNLKSKTVSVSCHPLSILPQTVNISATTSYSSPNMSQYSLDGTKRAGFVVLPELQPSTVTGAPTSLIWITYGTTPFSIALQRVQDGQLYAINLLGGRSTACGTFTMNSAASCYSDTGRFILSSGDNTNLPSGTYTGQLVVSMQDWVSTYRQVLDLNITYSK